MRSRKLSTNTARAAALSPTRMLHYKRSQLGSAPSRQQSERLQTLRPVKPFHCCSLSAEAEHHLLLWATDQEERRPRGLTGALLGPYWGQSLVGASHKDPPKYHNDSTSLRVTGWFFPDDDG